MAEDAVDAAEGRPYRSHKYPACDFCHRRKARCVRTHQSDPCSLCRLHQKECLTSTGNRNGPRRPRAAFKKPGILNREPAASTASTPNDAVLAMETEQEVAFGPDGLESGKPLASPAPGLMEKQSGHILGPGLAHDAQMLEQYMSPRDGTAVSHVRPNPYSVYSDDPRDPVVYIKVPRHRSSHTNGNGTMGFEQCEIIENILGPLKSALFDLYFNHIHPAFPILDQAGVANAYKQDTLPYALTCEIYAVSTLFWDLSPTIANSGRPRPNIHYIWNQAVNAMKKDFLSPTFSTVLSCILDIWGRPITSITYNAINIGSTVALAQSLGLNRNPSRWNLDPRQKDLRIKAWWGLLIHDYWASLCHGTPSHIHRNQWDVPLPKVESLVHARSGKSITETETLTKGAQTFVSLCELTNLLGEALPLIYSLKSESLDKTKLLRRLETSLDGWESSLPQWLNAESAEFDRRAPGALNLRLSYFALRICMSRIAFQETRVSGCDPDEAQYLQSQCRKAAASLIDFVISLSKDETQAFWLPYAAYHFVSAATLMMRCALETQSDSTARNCVEKARSLIDYLRDMKTEADWDLANICLGQCEMTVKQMSESRLLDFRQRSQSHIHRTRAPLARGKQTREDQHQAEPSPTGATVVYPTEDGLDSGEPTMPPTGITSPSTNRNLFTGPYFDIRDWQAEAMGDFYFPELWQVSHLDF